MATSGWGCRVVFFGKANAGWILKILKVIYPDPEMQDTIKWWFGRCIYIYKTPKKDGDFRVPNR